MRISALLYFLTAVQFLSLPVNRAAAASFFENMEKPKQSPWLQLAARTSCKQVSSCEEAVQIWCDGYSRADGDGDGIPCENVCHSKEDVDQIKQQIGC